MMSDMDLTSDCGNCFGLCCTALELTRSADFAFDKPSGEPCRHLDEGFGCGIHAGLRRSGMPGCTVYECFGAGQQVSQVTYAGVSWRAAPDTAAPMLAVFSVMRALHEILALIEDVGAVAGPLRERVLALTTGGPDDILAVDLGELRTEAGAVLSQVSRGVRREGGLAWAGRDLVGKDLRAQDLADADLRGALLIGADLRDVALTRTDLLGADLRAADLRGTDLGSALFVTQPQLNAAVGDGATVIPAALERPGHWT